MVNSAALANAARLYAEYCTTERCRQDSCKTQQPPHFALEPFFICIADPHLPEAAGLHDRGVFQAVAVLLASYCRVLPDVVTAHPVSCYKRIHD